MSRIRFIFEKRGFSSFVRHVELPQLFGRIARRAGFKVSLTHGMSPHPHIVMGPALPVGVISIYEAAEIWFDGDVSLQDVLDGFNANLPTGFRFLKATFIPDESKSLNKCINAAQYWLCPRNMESLDAVSSTLLQDFPREILLKVSRCQDGLEIVTYDPSQTGPGVLVKDLVAHEVITGWPDICIARLCLGQWCAENGEIIPLL